MKTLRSTNPIGLSPSSKDSFGVVLHEVGHEERVRAGVATRKGKVRSVVRACFTVPPELRVGLRCRLATAPEIIIPHATRSEDEATARPEHRLDERGLSGTFWSTHANDRAFPHGPRSLPRIGGCDFQPKAWRRKRTLNSHLWPEDFRDAVSEIAGTLARLFGDLVISANRRDLVQRKWAYFYLRIQSSTMTPGMRS